MGRLGMGILVVAIAVGCGQATSSPSATAAAPTVGASSAITGTPAPQATGSARDAGWLADIEALLPAMERLHPDLYHGTSRATLEGAIDALRAGVATASDDELLVGVLRTVALVSAKGRDGHTGAFVWGDGTYPVRSLPLRVWLFGDGPYVVDALEPHRDLIGARIESIAGRPISDVLAALDPLVPRDNPTTVRLVLPRFLLIPEVLRGVGLVAAAGPIEFGVIDSTGRAATRTVAPIAMADYNAWAGAYGLFLPGDPNVRYLARSEEPLWQTVLEDTGTLYVQYNRVEVIGRATLADLATAAARPDVRRIVLDVRHNYGGEVHAYPAVLEAIRVAAARHPGRLFVITGRNTFSAASMFAAELDAKTDAVFVGEPMGGSPNLYGNSRPVQLENSGIVVQVSTTWNEAVPGDERLTIEPDVPAPLSAADYFAGRDPALEAILAASN